MRRPASHLRARRLGAVLTVAATAVALATTQAAAYGLTTPGAAGVPEPTGQLEREHLADVDVLAAATPVEPTAAQLDAVEALGATARWSSFGTPQSLIRYGEVLDTDIRAATPTEAARAFFDRHHALYRLDSGQMLAAHAEIRVADDAWIVVLQQRVAGLPVSPGGFASVGLVGSARTGWDIVYVSSSMAPQMPLSGTVATTAGDAVASAAAAVGTDLDASDVTTTEFRNGWRLVDDGTGTEQLVRMVAFPTADGFRPAYEVYYLETGLDGHQDGYRHILDAADGGVLLRENIVHQLDDDPSWQVYPAHPQTSGTGKPPWNYPSVDKRVRWCWAPAPDCDLVVGNPAAGVPWDVDPVTGMPTFTTSGNAVVAFESWFGNTVGQQPIALDRRYDFPFTNVWYRTGCHSDNFVPGGNDIDASVTNLFVANWRMHDWSYHLGFTEQTWNAQAHNFGRGGAENDPVLARAQAGAVTPGSRNNATMATRPDGVSSIMSMFLWQPQAAAFHGPCVAGDYDMTVIGHEYTHMIENRLIGKGGGRSGFHAGAMGESWSDFIAAEYLNEYGFASAAPHNPFTIGAYVTGNPHRGIRNYNMSFPSAGELPQAGRDVHVNTLHFGSMGYDITGPQVHADSQIWSAVNHDLRTLFLERYPDQGGTRQVECADGTRPVDECPGNRRWIQLVFDAMLLMPTAPTMLDARDAYFAADMLRFGGANQDLLWLGFARRGFGEHASVNGPADTDPVPSFESPLHEEATLRFVTVAAEDGTPVDAEIYVGNYEARVTPIGSVVRFVPDPDGYNFVARADGYGHVRFVVDKLKPGEDRTITVRMPTNVASIHQGATASGDGIRHSALIDDTEATNWQNTFDLPNLVVIDAPSSAAGSYGASGADFGPALTPEGFTGAVVLVDDGSANPTEGCGPLIGFPAGAIALVDRGTCPFTEKVANAQAAGASAVIVVNNAPGAPIQMGGTDPSITIPSVMVSQADGAAIKAGLPATGTVRAAGTPTVAGSHVVIALDGPQQIRYVQASAMLLPDQNRFTAVRQFELYACTAGNPVNPTCDGSVDAGWKRILRSHKDAFPAPNPRPSSPDLILRGFEVPTTTATHVKFVVLTNQCTGNPDYQGAQHADPLTPSGDCRDSAVGAGEVRAAELQLLTSKPRVDGAKKVG